MADYLDKWKEDFPETINNQTRPTEGVDNTLEFNTDGFPQRITNDPVHAKLENDLAKQLFSNDQRLKDDIDSIGIKEENHEKDSSAHARGISGNAGSATKLATARTIQTNLASTSAASFDGTANIKPGVSGILPVISGGTGKSSLADVTVGTAQKLQTAQTIALSGNASGSAVFNGSSNITINTKVSESAHAVATTKLETARTIQTNLGSTKGASFNGTANVSPGVTGILSVANGGTGSASEKYVQLSGDTMNGALQFILDDKPNTAPAALFQKDIINIKGNDGNRYGFIRLTHNTNGSHIIQIGNVNNSNSPSGGLDLYTDTSGDLSNIKGVTPIASVSGNELVTASWVRALTTGTLSNKGWTKLPNNMIIQWIGTQQCNVWAKWPITFPNKCVALTASISAYSSLTNKYAYTVENKDTSTFQVSAYRDVNKDNDIYAFVIGIGY